MSTEDNQETKVQSPTDSQKTVSDDDEIDYSVKPEFYDPKLDDKDQLWVQKRRKGQYSDAVLSCPACFTTLSLECQRHEKYVTQYRAIFVSNCKIKNDQVAQPGLKRKRGKRGRGSSNTDSGSLTGETFKPVCCSTCSTEVGVIDEDEFYWMTVKLGFTSIITKDYYSLCNQIRKGSRLLKHYANTVHF